MMFFTTRLGIALCFCLITVLLAGCGAKYTVSELAIEDLKDGGPIDGLPFRIKERYRVEVYKLVNASDKNNRKYQLLTEQNSDGVRNGSDEAIPLITIANPDRLFVLHFKGDALADSKPSFGLNQDGTLKNAKIEGITDHSLEALDTLSTEIGEFETARKASKPVSPEDADLIDALAKRHTAENAQITLDSLPDTATESERRTARQNLEVAMLAANLAAKKAKIELPYPDFAL